MKGCPPLGWRTRRRWSIRTWPMDAKRRSIPPVEKEDAPSSKGPVDGIIYSEVQNTIDSYDSPMAKSHKVLFIGRWVRRQLPLRCAKF